MELANISDLFPVGTSDLLSHVAQSQLVGCRRVNRHGPRQLLRVKTRGVN